MIRGAETLRPSAGVDAGVHRLVEAQVRRWPDRCAVRDASTGASLTYGELWDASGAAAGELLGAGVQPGDVVAVALCRSLELVVALLATARAGAAYLPLDLHAPPLHTAAILDDAAPACVAVRPRSDIGGLPPHLPRVTVPGPTTSVRRRSAGTTGVGVGDDDPAYVAFTSGTSGRAKGVVVPHRGVRRLVTNPRYCTIEPGDRVANVANPAFDATTFEIWAPLAAGATVVVLPSTADAGADGWLDVVRREAITTMFLTTSLFHMLARERPHGFRALRTLLVGGESLEASAVRGVLEAGAPARFVNVYGPTETTTFATFFDCTRASVAGIDRVPIGYAIQETTLHVLDERATPVAAGERGELCIGGPGVALGYLRRPELTAERFVPARGDDGGRAVLYRTGDVVRQAPSGALELLGRRDRQVKLRGFRVELEHVERAVMETGLVDAAVVEKVDDGPSARLVAFVLPAHGATRTGAGHPLSVALSTALAVRVPAYMVPSRFIELEALPLGPSGKTDRAALLDLLAAPPGPTTLDAAPDGPGDMATQVADLWRRVLAIDQARSDDNFIDAGGNSILAIQLASRLRQTLALDCEPADVLLAESLGELIEKVRQAPRVP